MSRKVFGQATKRKSTLIYLEALVIALQVALLGFGGEQPADAQTAPTTAGGTFSMAWGSDGVGQLGDGTTYTNGTTPVQVSGLTDAKAIAAG